MRAAGGPAVCADESCHTAADLERLVEHYHAVNIKLDKCGGLTPALRMLPVAQHLGLEVMVGCMVCSSLAIAPAMLLAGRARWADLDGAELLSRDRPGGAPTWTVANGAFGRELWG